MLNLKKLIASICAATVALTSVAFAANYSDVTEDSAYYEAVETLSKLDIFTGYEDGTFKPEDTVTRAEMSALIARILGYDETAKGAANTIFTDVPSTHWASGYIAQATNMNILNGYGDGTFGPDDQVTYEQAVKMIMATLGYTPYAENNGGYPTGYLAAAQKYSVTKGVSNAVIGSGANRGTIAQLLNNAIDTPLMEQSSWNTNGEIEYTIYDGGSVNGGGYRERKTLMSENLGVVKLAGVVTANSVTDLGLSGNIYDATAEVKIAVKVTDNYKTTNTDFAGASATSPLNKSFVVGNTDAEAYLGQAVIVYVFENDKKDYEVISIAADTTKNDVVEFTLDQFDYFKPATATTDAEIYYFANASDDNSTSKKVTASTVVYNGEGNKTIANVLPAAGADINNIVAGGNSLYGGKITLIDNDTKAGYDVVFVEVATTAVVDEVSDELVSFKTAAVMPNDDTYSELEFDADDDNTLIELTKDGEVIDYTELKEWDVLSLVAANDDNKGYIQARVISNTVTGVITADFTSKTSAANYSATTKKGQGFKIDGTKYDVAAGAYKSDKLAVGDGGTFYIDEYGKIAAFNEDSSVATGSAGNYAYIYKTAVDTNALGDTVLTIQMITANGVEVVDAASTITFYAEGASAGKTVYTDGTVATSGYGTVTATSATDKKAKIDGKEIDGTVVKYTTNSAGYVKTITMADYDVDKFADANYSTTGEEAEYKADNGKLGSKFVDEDTIVFFVAATADKSAVGTLADLADEQKYQVKAMYYDNKADDNNIVVLVGGKDKVDTSSSVAVITDLSAGKNENDENVLYISYIQDGQEVEGVETVDKAELAAVASTLSVGDVIKIKVNSAGKIATIDKVMDFNDGGRADSTTAALSGYFDASNGGFGGARNTTTNKFENGKDAYYGGVVAYAKNGGKVAFDLAATGNVSDSYSLVNLAKAENIYVVDFSGRNVSVKRGSASSFRYNEKAYATTSPFAEIQVDDVKVDDVNGTTAAIDKYTDHVFVREYDGNIEEVIIVKCPLDVKFK